MTDSQSMIYHHCFDFDESDGMVWDYSESMSFDFVESPHELYLQEHGCQYSCPTMFQDGMDSEECAMYYNIVDAQQHGGVQRRSNDMDRCHIVHRDFSSFDKKSGPPSILKKSKYTTSETMYESPRPRFIRRFSIAYIPPIDDTNGIRFNTVRRAKSFCCLNKSMPSNRVGFCDHVQVFTIYPIYEIPYDVRQNLWSSREELEYYRQNAYEVCDEDDEEELRENSAVESLLGKVQEDSLRSVIVAEDDKTFSAR